MLHALAQHKWIIPTVVAMSSVTLLLTVVALPLVILHLRADYFITPHRQHNRFRQHHPLIGAALCGLKNVLGALFILSGLVMLVTPGQGLLSILIGMVMMNYPGKFRCERWLASRPGIWRVLNWIRRKGSAIPFEQNGA